MSKYYFIFIIRHSFDINIITLKIDEKTFNVLFNVYYLTKLNIYVL